MDRAASIALVEEIAVAAGYSVATDEREQLARTGTPRFHRASFQLDVTLASLPFVEHEHARTRATTERLFGWRVALPTPEDLIVMKVVAGRDKDLVDAISVVRRHRATLDHAYVRATLDDLCDLAEDAGPRQRFEAVLCKASV